MKNFISPVWQVWATAAGFWVVLFIISALFINPETGEPVMDLYMFHLLMFVISVIVLYGVFSWFKKRDLLSFATYATFLLVNIALDFVILIPFFGVSVGEWVTLILPSYIAGTGIMYALFKV